MSNNKEKDFVENEIPENEELVEEGKTEESKEEMPVEEQEDANQKYLRLMADFQNFKRRAEKERSDVRAYANEKIIIELLEVIDNFERALDHELEGAGNFKEGMVMIFEQLKNVITKAGVEELDPINKDFDPNFHNAVMTDSSGEFESGKVSKVLQKGYILNNKVIRPAMVMVAE